MIVLTGNVSRPKGRRIFAPAPAAHTMGMMLSPTAWRTPDWCVWACDNDAFAHSFMGSRPDAHWWHREGETAWLKMLDKAALQKAIGNPPLFVLLPDVVGDWRETVYRAWHYKHELEDRGLPVAVALQNAPIPQVVAAATMLTIDWWFVGGTTRWKWGNLEALTLAAHSTFDTRIHVGRASGRGGVRECLRVGVDSCDGSKWAAFSDTQMPKLYDALDGARAQLSLL